MFIVSEYLLGLTAHYENECADYFHAYSIQEVTVYAYKTIKNAIFQSPLNSTAKKQGWNQTTQTTYK